MTMIPPTVSDVVETARKRIDTNAEGTLKASIALVRAIRSLRRNEDNVELVPGWRVLHPTAAEMAEVREFQLIEAQVGSDAPYILPRAGESVVMVDEGTIEISDGEGHVIGDLGQTPNPYFKHKGEAREIRALTWPTSALVISYRERDRADDAKSPI